MCGLGQTAPNPVLSTLRYYRNEYEAHVKEKRCPSLKCKQLIRYVIDPTKCVGCTACARVCPVNAISGEVRKVHQIDNEVCIRCGSCIESVDLVQSARYHREKGELVVVDREKVHALVREAKSESLEEKDILINTLHKVQDYFGNYIPVEAAEIVAEELVVPKSKVYEVLTFYTMFSTKAERQICDTCLCKTCHAM